MKQNAGQLIRISKLLCVTASMAIFLTATTTTCARKPKSLRTVVKTSPSSSFGINAHIPSTEDFKLMHKAGISWVRVDFTWDVLEPRKGVYRWDISDRVVMDARTYGIKILAILGYCPRWASSGGDKTFPPKSKHQWKGFVRTIVNRYKGNIHYWTLWNEPNSETFFHGNIDSFINDVLIPGATAAKEADQSCRIVGPDLAHLGGSDWDKWFDGILHRVGGYLDVISHHCYKDKPYNVLNALDGSKRLWDKHRVKSIIKRRDQENKPFWLTEVGWRSTKIGEERQAGYEVALLKGIALRPWISKVFLFELRDSPGLPGYGLLHRNGKPKPAYIAYKGFIASKNGKDHIKGRTPIP